MLTKKVIMTALLIVILSFKAEGKFVQNKYSQTTHNFLDTNTSNLFTISDAIDYTSKLLECDIIKAEKKFRKDIPVWKVYVITKERGTAVFEISATDKNLISIDAGEGPFEYEIKPDKEFISFTEAKKKAEDHSGQKTLKWKYLKNKNNWEYNFWVFIKSGKAQIRVDAASGDIVTAKKKK
jgi:hypothetical protein